MPLLTQLLEFINSEVTAVTAVTAVMGYIRFVKWPFSINSFGEKEHFSAFLSIYLFIIIGDFTS